VTAAPEVDRRPHDEPAPETYEQLTDHEQDELERLHTEYGKAHARLDQERRDAINRDTPKKREQQAAEETPRPLGW